MPVALAFRRRGEIQGDRAAPVEAELEPLSVLGRLKDEAAGDRAAGRDRLALQRVPDRAALLDTVPAEPEVLVGVA